ncbi:MAG: FAD-binding protein [Comamonadaceae bacterium]|nr:FAD-binding protein [Comamonadaceae bacterium]
MAASTTTRRWHAHCVDRVQAARAADGARCDIRGGGTKAFYGEPPQRRAAATCAPLAGISSYEPSELVVTVRAGTPLAELEAALAEQGQCLPFEPPRFARRRHGRRHGRRRAGRARRAPRSAACATTCSAPRCSTAAARC